MIFRIGDKRDYSQCLDILKSAFWKYPFFEVYKAKDHQLYFEIMMKIWMDNSFKYGSVLVVEENSQIVGLAVLKAPNDKEIDIIDFLHIESSILVDLAGIDNLNSFINMCQVSDLACHSLPDPKWHLVLLAVCAEHKGRGIGSQILQKSVLPYISARGGGLLTFNTNAEENRSFYQKNGFDEFDETILFESGVQLGNWSYKMEIPI